MKKRSEFLDTILEYNPNYDIDLSLRAYDGGEMPRGQLENQRPIDPPHGGGGDPG